MAKTTPELSADPAAIYIESRSRRLYQLPELWRRKANRLRRAHPAVAAALVHCSGALPESLSATQAADEEKLLRLLKLAINGIHTHTQKRRFARELAGLVRTLSSQQVADALGVISSPTFLKASMSDVIPSGVYR